MSGGAEGHRWYDTWEEGGTTVERFVDFIQQIIDDIGPGTAERRFCFTMDNLAAHLNTMVFDLIIGNGHRMVRRAPYYPVDGPIEYVFNTLQNLLNVFMREIHDMDTLRHHTHRIITSMGNFQGYFRHVGFEYHNN